MPANMITLAYFLVSWAISLAKADDDRYTEQTRNGTIGPFVGSAVQQKNTNNGMALKSVQYLCRGALECRFAQLQCEAARILFSNATPCN
jgi:hypothetical protein